jgi:hypothetical protein
VSELGSRPLYRSSNGDTWELHGEGEHVFVLHRANPASGGHVSRLELSEFLSRGNGPEQQALMLLIRSLLDPVTGDQR